MGIAMSLEQGIDGYMGEFVTKTIARLTSELIPVALVGVTIYIIVYGFAVMRGETGDPIPTFVWKAFKIALITAIALGAGTYQEMIVGTLSALQNGLIHAVSDASSIGQALDDMEKPFFALWSGLFQKATDVGLTSMWPWMLGGIIALAAHLFVMVSSLGIFLVAKISLGLVMAVGPIFVFALIFPPTAALCESWAKQALQLTLTNVLIGATLGMSTAFCTKYAAFIVASTEATNVVSAVASLAIVAIVMALIVKNHPMLAQALVGGLSMGGIDLSVRRPSPITRRNAVTAVGGKNEIRGGGSSNSASRHTMSNSRSTTGITGTASRGNDALYNRTIRNQLKKK